MTEEADAVFTHFQKQINTLARFLGQAMAAMAFDDPKQREILEHVLTAWEGLSEHDRSKQMIMAHVRDTADRMLSASRRHHPDPNPPHDDDFRRG